MRNKLWKKVIAVSLVVAMNVSSVILSDMAETAIKAYANDTILSLKNNGALQDDGLMISSDTSMGNLLAQKLEAAQQQLELNAGYNIFEVTVNGTKATAELETLQNCQLVVGIYSEDGKELQTLGTADIVQSDSKAEVTFDTDSIPEYFLIRAFLIDDTMSPLCSAYESTVYTKEMQEFLAKTTDDFTQERVLNLDNDKTNNFAVYKDNVTRISENNGKNIVLSVDETNNIYIFKNVDSAITGLKPGDIFACENNGKELIIKVSKIAVEGKNATIYSEDTSLEEVFDYVKIDNSQDIEDASIDISNMQEGVIFDGMADYSDDDADVYSEDFVVLAQNDDISRMSKPAIDIEGKFEKEAGFTFDKVPMKYNDDTYAEIKGGIKFAAAASAKVYITIDYQYLELKLDYSAKVSLGFEEKLGGRIKLCEIGFEICPGFYIGFTPSIVIQADLKLELSGTLKGTVGFKYGSEKGFENISSNPQFNNKIDVEGSLYIGLSMEPKVTILTENISKVWINSEVGVTVDAKVDFDREKEGEYIHDCDSCIAGSIYAKANVSAGVKFLKSDKLSVSTTLLDTGEIPIADFYYSETYNDGGWGKCKHYRYNVKCVVYTNMAEDSKNVLIRVDGEQSYKTNNDSFTEIYLSNGEHELIFIKGGYQTVKKTVKVTGSYKNDFTILTRKSNENNSEDSNRDDQDDNKEDVNKENDIVFQSVSLGDNHSAAITEDGSLYTWGNNRYGQLGNGKTDNSNIPIKIMNNVKSISLYDDISAAITEDGELYLWGKELGNSYNCYETPQRVMNNVKSISLCSEYGAVITEDGSLYILHGYKPQKIMDNVKKVSVTASMTAAITKDGELYTWGSNEDGQLGDGTEKDSEIPQKIMDGVRDVYVGGWHNTFITESGDLYIWGYNYFADGKTYVRYTPEKILNDVKCFDIGAGLSAAITEDGSLYTWGFYYLGNGKPWYYDSILYPVKIMDNVNSVSVSNKYGAVITKNGDLYTWGDNEYGVLGDGTHKSRNKPVKIMDNVNSVNLSGVDEKLYIAVVKDSGSLYTWGSNNYGKLGNGTNERSSVPIKIMDNIKLPTLTSQYTLSDNIVPIADNETANLTLNITHPVIAPQVTSIFAAIEPQLLNEVSENTYSNLTPGADYMIYIVESDEKGKSLLSSDNILYINQGKADENGTLTFDYTQKPSWQNVKKVLIGGDFDGNIVLDDTVNSISGIIPQTTISALKDRFHKRFVVLDSNYKEIINDSDYIATGNTICLLDADGNNTNSYTVCVKGDLDGDGTIGVIDMEAAQKHILGMKKLTGVYKNAAMLTADESDVSVLDMEVIQKHILGIAEISA